MASSKEYLEYVLDQLSGLEDIAYKPMMGEYILYYEGKIIGGIYDDRFLVKPVRSAKALMPNAPLDLPYEGAKEMLLVEDVDDRAFLKELLNAMIYELPTPKKKKKTIPIQNRPSQKQNKPQSDEELCRAFFEAVLRQEPAKLRGFFQKDAVIEWSCTNERFTLEEYIRANCDYPGEWDGELCSILPAEEQTVLITRVWTKDKSASFHCVSVIKVKRNKIVSLTEYWSDDGPAPQWRQDMGIGKPIDEKA